MATLKRQQWPAGYTPGNNEFNGDANGLLIADNLTFDEAGIVRLSKGTAIESTGPFSGNGEEIFSTVFDLATLIDSSFPGRAKVRYVGESTGQILRNYGPGSKSLKDYDILIANSALGTNGVYAFGSAFGHTLIFSGSAKIKDRGDLQHRLGFTALAAPLLSVNPPPSVVADDRDGSNFYTRWDTAAVEGTLYAKSADFINVKTAALENFSRAIIQRGTLTSTNINLDQLMPSGTGTSEDLFNFNLRLEKSEYFIKVRVEYILAIGTDVENYYWHEWTNRVVADVKPDTAAPDMIPADMDQAAIDALATANPGVSFVSSIREGQNVWTPLMCKRGEFNRVGADDAMSWSTVKGIRITYYTTQDMEILFNEARFIGGSNGPLTGEFQYIQQDLRDTNSYIEFGIPSPESSQLTAYATSVRVTPRELDPQANGFRIYRLSNATDGYYVIKQGVKQRITSWSNAAGSSVVNSGAHGLVTGNIIHVEGGYGAWANANGSFTVTVTGLDTFTTVEDTSLYGPMTGDLSFVNISPFDDTITDAEALYGGGVNRLDRNKALLPDDIIGMIAPYFGRVIYLTTKFIVPSEQNDPARYDTRYLIENAADTGEINLFIEQMNERFILIGTTKGFYSLSGDGTVVDSVINFKLDTVGTEQPPISNAHCVNNSILFYYAADGIRYIEGSSSGLLTLPLRLQWPPWSEYRYGHSPYKIVPALGTKSSFVTVGGKLYAALDQGDIGRSVLIYDFIYKRFEYRRNATAANNPYSMFVEEDGVILFTTEATGDRFLHQMEVGFSYDNDTVDQQFEFLTIYDDDGKSSNRKDALTMFIDAESFTANLTINLLGLRDDNTYQSLVFTQGFNGRKRIAFDCSAMLPYKSYALSITGTTKVFKLYEFSLEYQDRPIQVNFLRIPPNNYGIAGRKRIPEIPMLIDTLGNTVSFTPILDNTTLPSVNFTKTDKDVFHFVFNEEQAAYVVGGTLKTVTPGGLFEFYDLITPREVEPLPDPLSYKHIPYTNLGNASRKRFIQFAFIINTYGVDVTFSPFIDSVAFPTQVYNTSRRRTVIYTFVTEAIGIDVGGILNSNVDNVKFEYFGVDLGECISEKLPPVARYVKVPCTNFGTAAKKRVRTLPLVIDTRGGTVTFTPSVDGVTFPSSQHITNDKRTVLHFFTEDAIGIDYCGLLTSPTEFEYYGYNNSGGTGEKPESVEVLPVEKMFDQIGPVELKRWGRIYMARVRVVPSGAALSYDLIINNVSAAAGTWQTTADKDQILEIKFEKFVMGDIVRLELRSGKPFSRLNAELLVRLTGNDTDNRWIKL